MAESSKQEHTGVNSHWQGAAAVKCISMPGPQDRRHSCLPSILMAHLPPLRLCWPMRAQLCLILQFLRALTAGKGRRYRSGGAEHQAQIP